MEKRLRAILLLCLTGIIFILFSHDTVHAGTTYVSNITIDGSQVANSGSWRINGSQIQYFQGWTPGGGSYTTGWLNYPYTTGTQSPYEWSTTASNTLTVTSNNHGLNFSETMGSALGNTLNLGTNGVMNGTLLDMVNPSGNYRNTVNITSTGTMNLTNLNVYQGNINISGANTTINGAINAGNNSLTNTAADGYGTQWRLTGGNYTATSTLNTTGGANGATNNLNLSGDISFNHAITQTAITSASGGYTDTRTNMTVEKVLNTAGGLTGITNITTDINNVAFLGGAMVNQAALINVSGATTNNVTFNLTDTDSGAWGGGANHGFYTFAGQVDLSAAATNGASNSVSIISGRLDRGATEASIIASTGATTITITGGTTRYIETSGGVITLSLTNGRFDFKDPNGTVGGINAQDYNTYSLVDPKEDLIAGSTATFSDGEYLVYTLLNIGDTVTVEDDAYVTIGAIDYNDNIIPGNRYDFSAVSLGSTANGWNYGLNQSNGREAQITANLVDVEGTLVIHENIDNWGKDITQIAADEHNIINVLTVNNGGRVTIDRTSIHGLEQLYDQDGNPMEDGSLNPILGSQVNVEKGGILHGFGHYGGNVVAGGNTAIQPGSDLYGDKTPVRSNVDGNVTLEAGTVNLATGRVDEEGGRIQPYNTSLFSLGWDASGEGERDKTAVEKLMGVVFRTEHIMEFQETSVLSTRLFADRDLTYNPDIDIYIDGTKLLYYSDAVLAETLVFSKVSAAIELLTGGQKDMPIENNVTSKTIQSTKVQYDPVFGLHNELISKLDFKLYQGNGIDDTQTYYFNVATSLNTISELNGYDDANHLFNRMILKSDMLGEWTFLYDEDQENIVLRYRMLAEHPQNGGLVTRETERNNILVAKYLDEIRYPFVTDTTILNLPKEYPGDIVGLEFDSSSYYTNYDNSNAHNADTSLDHSKLIYNNSGYDGNMVQWYRDHLPGPATQWRDEYMLDWEDLLHAFQLELQDGGAGMSRGLRMLHGEVYANLGETNMNVMSQFIRNRERNSVSALYEVENPNYPRDYDEVDVMFDPVLDAGRMDRFVQNPIRFWASGFGTTGSGRKSGTEYGYNQEIWGGALGVVKEFGDLYAGVTAGFSRSRNTWDAMPSTGITKSYLAEALLGYRLPGLMFAEAHVNYTRGEQSMSRNILVYPTPGDPTHYYQAHLKGKFNDDLFAGGVRVGWQKPFWGSWLFLPTAGFQALHYRAPGFEETADRANVAPRLKVHKGDMNRTMYKVPLMARVSRVWAINDTMILTPEIRAGFTPLLGNTRGKVKAEWAGNPFPGRTFISYGVDRGDYEAELGATIELSRKGRFYVAGNYDLVYSQHSTMHNYSLQAGWNF